MRIMSYNIQSGKNINSVFDIAATGDVIAGIAPDICALNEVRMRTTDVQGLELARVLGERTNMQWRFARTIDINGGEYGIGMLSRYPIVESTITPIPYAEGERIVRHYEPRTVLSCILETEAGRICAVTSHFGLDTQDRRAAVQTVLGVLPEDMPVVFMGDLNAQPDEDTIAILRSRLHDSAADTPLTFPSNEPKIKIDYIFTSAHFAPAQLHTLPTTASDHLPVYIDTALR